jgi:hypothetical protein
MLYVRPPGSVGALITRAGSALLQKFRKMPRNSNFKQTQSIRVNKMKEKGNQSHLSIKKIVWRRSSEWAKDQNKIWERKQKLELLPSAVVNFCYR